MRNHDTISIHAILKKPPKTVGNPPLSSTNVVYAGPGQRNIDAAIDVGIGKATNTTKNGFEGQACCDESIVRHRFDSECGVLTDMPGICTVLFRRDT